MHRQCLSSILRLKADRRLGCPSGCPSIPVRQWEFTIDVTLSATWNQVGDLGDLGSRRLVVIDRP